ncbi:PWI domain-containing protein [Cryptosporidium ubiquitum]|uniref:PWI domain-containing protein n=1 Tax=Cryptosporidium ubiquitum TaxID=857276 RepID=A0A1J4MHQ5_9CRYT|nr:PWI domain-containing protein [Cryptosporidium ubiquitum]OII73766.1 PWI domain-containing protein [Cryptosporidium ubiquitum]
MGIFEQKINFNSIPVYKVRRWISSKTEKILGKEDEIFIDYCINQLKYKIRKSAAEEELQISPNELVKNIEGFLGEKATEFVTELWDYILRSENNNENSSQIQSSKNHNSKKNMNLKRNFKHSNDLYNDEYNFIRQRSKNNERAIYTRIYRRNANYTYNRYNPEESSRLFPTIAPRRSKENKRVRSLSRSLSPESYESYGIKEYKYEKTPTAEENFSIDKINHLEKNIDKIRETNERISDIRKRKTFEIEKTFSSNTSSLDNRELESPILTNNKIEEHHLRMKALEVLKRKSEVKNCRSESEEILRARAIEKFIKKKPIKTN